MNTTHLCKDCRSEGNHSIIVGDVENLHYYLCNPCSAKRSRNAFFTPQAQKQIAFLKSLTFKN